MLVGNRSARRGCWWASEAPGADAGGHPKRQTMSADACRHPKRQTMSADAPVCSPPARAGHCSPPARLGIRSARRGCWWATEAPNKNRPEDPRRLRRGGRCVAVQPPQAFRLYDALPELRSEPRTKLETPTWKRATKKRGTSPPVPDGTRGGLPSRNEVLTPGVDWCGIPAARPSVAKPRSCLSQSPRRTTAGIPATLNRLSV